MDKELGRKRFEIDEVQKRRMCREYAEKYIDIQRDEFKRLGVFGDWERPYLTMSYDYEAATVRELARFIERGGVYLGLKPVHWAPGLRTALAEAEVEYEDITTPSIYVKFPIAEDQLPGWAEKIEGLSEAAQGTRVSVLIWTTTPWTLPANLALAFSETLEYGVFRHGEELLIFHEHFLPQLQSLAEQEGASAAFEKVAGFQGGEIEGLHARHPWVERDSLVVKADYVTLDQGTGVVHTAPGHGREDYETGLKYGLEVYSPIADDGKFTDDVAHFAGQFVFDADPNIIAHLRESGRLFAVEDYTHPYPHDWRSHRPTIFRATPQWFISMEHGDLRKRSLEEIRKVAWVPPWGEERIFGMIENRPDWCISRQRSWGVPIVAFHCEDCAHVVVDAKVAHRVADLMEEGGADVWFERQPGDLLPPDYKCPECGGASFRKETDILDVWFDSGVSQAAVLEKREELTWPSDMYLEGQRSASRLVPQLPARRRWRQGCGALPRSAHPRLRGGRQGQEDEQIPGQHDRARGDHQEIRRGNPETLGRRGELQGRHPHLPADTGPHGRGLPPDENTCRFLLGNLRDYESFDPALDAVPLPERMEIDRLIISRLDKLVERVRQAYADYEFHAVYHALNNFCAVDLSSFYLDVLKDRLYISLPDDVDRISGVSTMHEILDALLRMMAPILPFTAEEAYQLTPKLHGESIHLASLPEADAARRDEALEERWEPLMRARAEVLKALELVRQSQEKGKGSSLNFSVRLFAEESMREKLTALEHEMEDVFIVSGAVLAGAGEAPSGEAYQSEEVEGLAVEVNEARGAKCAMSWKISEDVGSDPRFPDLSARCARIAAQVLS